MQAVMYHVGIDKTVKVICCLLVWSLAPAWHWPGLGPTYFTQQPTEAVQLQDTDSGEGHGMGRKKKQIDYDSLLVKTLLLPNPLFPDESSRGIQ